MFSPTLHLRMMSVSSSVSSQSPSPTMRAALARRARRTPHAGRGLSDGPPRLVVGRGNRATRQPKQREVRAARAHLFHMLWQRRADDCCCALRCRFTTPVRPAHGTHRPFTASAAARQCSNVPAPCGW